MPRLLFLAHRQPAMEGKDFWTSKIQIATGTEILRRAADGDEDKQVTFFTLIFIVICHVNIYANVF